MMHRWIRYVYLSYWSVVFECVGKECNNVQGSDILILSPCKLVHVHISNGHLFKGAQLVPVFH
jgi:hypothetical protein